MPSVDNLYAVIMAGGQGTRFWPLSREARPKQLLPIAGSTPMIRATVDRILPLTPPERILVITGAVHASAIRSLLPDLPPENIIEEPVGRNTAPCIGLAAHVLARRAGGDAVMAVLPADHMVARTAEFRAMIGRAATLAAAEPVLVTLGVTPTHPETGYGYIEAGPEESGADSRPVIRFHEKPGLEEAVAYLASGRFFWNSGIFVWRTATILDSLKRHLPELAASLDDLAEFIDTAGFAPAMNDRYPDLPSVSIDFGLMEKARNVQVLPADLGWSDVGSWPAAAAYWLEQEGNAVMGQALVVDAAGCAVYSPHKPVALVGVQDLVVVDTPDALLICPKARAQDVRRVVELLKSRNRPDLL